MFVLWLLLIVVGGGSMLWAVVKTVAVDGEMWREKAKRREVMERVEPARRGTIYSSDGKVLATTIPVCDLCLDLGRWPKKDSKGAVVKVDGAVVMESLITNDSAFLANLGTVCQMLHEQFPHRPASYYRNRIMTEYKDEKPSRCLYVERKVPYSRWSTIKSMPGWEKCVVTKTSAGSVTSYERVHIYGNLGENTIGYFFADSNHTPHTGLEGYYDTVLKGQDGIYRCRRLTRGVWLPEEEKYGFIPDLDSMLMQRRVDGNSIISTIDTRYQDIAESALRKSMNQYGGQRGCAILMEVETGYVLACSNLTRDTLGRLRENPWGNVAVSDHYEPGSTFKTVAMMAMLNDKTIALDTSKRVRAGGVKTYSSTSGEISDGHGYATDTANLAGVLAKSSNVGMCELAWEYYRNRRDDLKKGIQEVFPFKVLHPDIAATETPTGIVRLGSDRDFLNLSYGYSATVSPLQLITYYNAVANGGRMVKPLFCREVLGGSRHSEMKPVVLNEHICTPATAKQMREMLAGVVEYGTGSNIYNTVYGIAGKTGTTQGITDRGIKNSSFVGFFPADNPRYTCLVLVERTSIAGRQAAAPVFKQIADCVVAFDKQLGSVRLQDSNRVVCPVVAKGDRARLEKAYHLLGLPFEVLDTVHPVTGWTVYDREKECYKNYALPVGMVPDCQGMTIRDAIRLLEEMGLKVRFAGQGKVVNQTPKARTRVEGGTTVVLELKP